MIKNPPWNSPPVYGPDPAFEEPPGRGKRLLERVPVEEITRQAKQVHPGRVLLTIIGGLLFGLGWLAAKTVGVAWLAMAWSGTAVQVGWREARGTNPPPPDLADVLADNQRLRMQLARLEGSVTPAGVA